MANLTIRNLDDEVVEKLKARAKENERSLEAEIRVLLTETAERPSRKTLRELAETDFRHDTRRASDRQHEDHSGIS